MSKTSVEEAEEQKPAMPSHKRVGAVVGLIVGLAGLVLVALVAHKHQLNGLNGRLFFDVNNLPDGFRTAAVWLTEILGGATAIVVSIIVATVFRHYKLAWRFAFTAGGAVAVSYVVKKLIAEPRPAVMLHQHLHARVAEAGSAFPSTHTTAATALALTLWLVLPWRWRWVSVIWIVVVALSRLYLGVHSPVDVIGAFALGLMAVCFVQLLPHGLKRRMALI